MIWCRFHDEIGHAIETDESLDFVVHWIPEHKLLAAILARAVYDCKSRSVEAEYREQAREWFTEAWLEKPAETRYGTFQYVCEHLTDGDPVVFRDKFLAYLRSRKLL